MNDPTYQLAELQNSRERWKLAALTSWLLLGLLALGGGGLALQEHAKARQARRQAEAALQQARDAEEMARMQAERALYAAAISQAQRQLEQTREPAPGLQKTSPKD